MNDTHFLVSVISGDFCSLSIATLEGAIAEIVRTPWESCPSEDFSLPGGY